MKQTNEAAPPLPRRNARKEARRQAILAAAQRLFLERGFSDTSMSAIAAELGGSKTTLWSYFPSKEALFAAVVDEGSKAHREEMASLLMPPQDFEQALHAFCRRLIQSLASPEARAVHQMIAPEAERVPEVGRLFFERVVRPTHDRLEGFLQNEIDKGGIQAKDPSFLATALMNLCLGGASRRVLWGMGGSGSFDDDAAFALKIFLAAYRSDAEARSAGGGHARH